MTRRRDGERAALCPGLRTGDRRASGARRLALTPTPENYRIWYVHLAGEDPALSQALAALLASGERIDEAHCGELYERFFVRVAEERTLLRAGQRLERARRASSTREVSAFSGETARYGTRIQRGPRTGRCGAQRRADPAIVRGMVEETIRMQDHARQVEGSLRASMSEIDGLRRDLQTAWSEARTDGLTGLANRKHFDQALRMAAAQAIEHGDVGLPAAGRHRPLQAIQ